MVEKQKDKSCRASFIFFVIITKKSSLFYYYFTNTIMISSIMFCVAQRCSVKKLFLKISQNSQENTCARVSFLIKLQAQACNFIIKETLAQVFFCEFCEISQNIFSYRTPPVAASVLFFSWRDYIIYIVIGT